ncbi:hypothetical protein ABZS88_17385 [Streptomyces sp. NPDC005480]|uniref:hypothetical protein n=1 Tax=Streptomyces sp. NPDC005480 TaxID=3154880 RepID=UPI0033AB78C4
MRRSVSTALVAFCAAATAGVTALAAAPAATAASPLKARAHYVDCRAGTGPEKGTQKAPWRTLAAVNAQRLGPGDQVLLKRGTRCTGTLTPNGAGAPGSPVRIAPYGSGAKPVIDGADAPDTVLLRNTQWIEVSDLEITNAANPGTKRRGVRVVLSDYGTGRHYRLTGLDIRGDDTKDNDGSAGILFSVTGSAKETHYDDVRVENNTVPSD